VSYRSQSVCDENFWLYCGSLHDDDSAGQLTLMVIAVVPDFDAFASS